MIPVEGRALAHQPVLLSQLLSLFESLQPPRHILDCNFGRGGHSLALLKKFPQAKITAIDCDDQAIAFGKELEEIKTGRIQLLRQNFCHFAENLNAEILRSAPRPASKLATNHSALAPASSSKKRYDLILMDLGPSSPQLHDPKRGFSFYQDGPLDMRMDRQNPLTAEIILNSYSKRQLIHLFQSFGEIKRPRPVVEKIIQQRKKEPFKSSYQLARLIQNQGPKRKRQKKHPATTWFLALRIAVNSELDNLKQALPAFLPLLAREGKLAVISFHSLEDRIVKTAFKKFVAEGQGALLNKKALQAGRQERRQNPACRSAKLRIFIKSVKYAQKKTAPHSPPSHPPQPALDEASNPPPGPRYL